MNISPPHKTKHWIAAMNSSNEVERSDVSDSLPTAAFGHMFLPLLFHLTITKLHTQTSSISVFVPHNEFLWRARPIHIPYIFNLFKKNDTLQRPCKCIVLVMSVDKTVDVLSLMAKSIYLARSFVYPCPPGHPHPNSSEHKIARSFYK